MNQVLFLLLCTLALTSATMFDDIANRAKQANLEILTEKLKRFRAMRMYGVLSKGITYNDIMHKIIQANVNEMKEGGISKKRVEQLTSSKNKESEQKRMEFLRRLAQSEIEEDSKFIDMLKREAETSKALNYGTKFTQFVTIIKNKWKYQRKALMYIEQAREAKVQYVEAAIRFDNEKTFEQGKRAEYYQQLALKKNDLAQKELSSAVLYEQRQRLFVAQKRSEIKYASIRQARQLLKESVERIKQFNINDEVM